MSLPTSGFWVYPRLGFGFTHVWVLDLPTSGFWIYPRLGLCNHNKEIIIQPRHLIPRLRGNHRKRRQKIHCA